MFCDDGVYDLHDLTNPILIDNRYYYFPYKIDDRLIYLDIYTQYSLKFADISDPSAIVITDSLDIGLEIVLSVGDAVQVGNVVAFEITSRFPGDIGILFLKLDDIEFGRFDLLVCGRKYSSLQHSTHG